MKTLGKFLVAGVLGVASLSASAGDGGYLCSFDTYIDKSDLYNSNGSKLSSVGQIIRQDRANVYNGSSSDGSDDCGLSNLNKRNQLQKAIDRSKISPNVKNAVKRGDVSVSVTWFNSHVQVELN